MDSVEQGFIYCMHICQIVSDNPPPRPRFDPIVDALIERAEFKVTQDEEAFLQWLQDLGRLRVMEKRLDVGDVLGAVVIADNLASRYGAFMACAFDRGEAALLAALDGVGPVGANIPASAA